MNAYGTLLSTHAFVTLHLPFPVVHALGASPVIILTYFVLVLHAGISSGSPPLTFIEALSTELHVPTDWPWWFLSVIANTGWSTTERK